MTMTHRTTYDPNTDAVDVRETVGDRDGFFTVSLPVSSDTRARDGEAFDVERLRGFAQQINSDRTVPVFLSHGRSELSEERYGALGKIGRVTNGGVETRDSSTLLTADLEIADPDDLANEGDTGDVEAALRWVRQQFRLGLGSVSVGWTEDTTGRDVPGDAELLEVSVVGVESDTEAQQAAAEPTEAAVRGFDSLPAAKKRKRTTVGVDEWAEPTDRERANDALDTLETYADDQRAHCRSGGRSRTGTAPPTAATVEEVLRQLGHGTHSTNVTNRLDELRAAGKHDYDLRRQREDILARLETVGEHRESVTPPSARGSGSDPVQNAVDTLRRFLGESTHSEGWR